MKIKIEFEGDQIDDSFDINCVIHANNMYAAIINTKDLIRSRLKYGEDLTSIEEQTLERIREVLYLGWDE